MKYTINQANTLRTRIWALRAQAERATEREDDVMVLVYDGRIKQLVKLLALNGVREAKRRA